jgi:hypothetical protein
VLKPEIYLNYISFSSYLTGNISTGSHMNSFPCSFANQMMLMSCSCVNVLKSEIYLNYISFSSYLTGNISTGSHMNSFPCSFANQMMLMSCSCVNVLKPEIYLNYISFSSYLTGNISTGSYMSSFSWPVGRSESCSILACSFITSGSSISRITAVGIHCADHATSSIRNSWH